MQDALTTLLSFIFGRRKESQLVESATAESLRLLLVKKTVGTTEVLFPYRHALIRAAIKELKYHDDARVAHLLGAIFFQEILATVTSPHILIPMPLSKERLRERGYNQVARIAHATGATPHITVREDVLLRSNTIPQTKLSRQERMQNLQGSFFVPRPTAIEGVDIILLDDVITTGATMTASSETLRAAGARSIRQVAIAH